MKQSKSPKVWNDKDGAALFYVEYQTSDGPPTSNALDQVWLCHRTVGRLQKQLTRPGYHAGPRIAISRPRRDCMQTLPLQG